MRNIRAIALLTIILIIFVGAAHAAVYSPAAVSVSASNSTSVALLDDGTVWQWGYVYGDIARDTPRKVDIAVVRKISAGDSHVLALKGDGTVWAWGSNKYGQLGDGTLNDSLAPVQVQGLTGVVAIAAGKDHSLALKGDGTVWAWGSNSYGQIGGDLNLKYSATPVQVGKLYNIKAISTGGSHCLAMMEDGSVFAWGENSHGILGDGTNESHYAPVQSKVYGVKAFDAGDGNHALAALQDGNVWAWGYNYLGQLGQGGTSLHDQGWLPLGQGADVYNPDLVRGVSDVKAVAAGGTHSVALAGNGTVWAWGSNSDGQLGGGTVGGNDRTSPAQVTGLSDVTAIDAGEYHTLALKSDGSVWAWGSNSEGQLGTGGASRGGASTGTPTLVLMSSQVPPSPTPTPIIAATPGPTAAGENGTNYLLIGAIGLLVVIALVIVAALVFLRSSKKKGK